MASLSEAQKIMLIEASRSEYLKVQDMGTQIGSAPLSDENEKRAFNLAMRGLLSRRPELEDRRSRVSVWQITPEGLALVDALQSK